MQCNLRRGKSYLRFASMGTLTAIALAMSLLNLCLASEGHIRIVKTDEGYHFFEAEAPVLFYRTAPKATEVGTYSRANYCHPIYGLDGQILTEDFPKDHPHHRGIFWAWHQVYVGDIPMGDMWACEDFTWDVHKVQILEPQQHSRPACTGNPHGGRMGRSPSPMKPSRSGSTGS